MLLLTGVDNLVTDVRAVLVLQSALRRWPASRFVVGLADNPDRLSVQDRETGRNLATPTSSFTLMSPPSTGASRREGGGVDGEDKAKHRVRPGAEQEQPAAFGLGQSTRQR
jgi:hypothetical protein